jgi:AraC-like DNA-binding protein
MLLYADLIERVLKGYQCSGAIILHPTFSDDFVIEKSEMKNKMPFHYIEQGGCILNVDDKEHPLEQGDLITLMKGSKYRLTNLSGKPYATTTLICGYFELSATNSQPLVDSFPKVKVIKRSDIEKAVSIKVVLEMLTDEVHQKLLGSSTIVNNLSNLFFVYILRHLLDNNQIEKGLLSGLADKQLSRALSAFHQDFSKQWSLELLAKEAAISRTKFVQKFRDLIGTTPAAYMAQWRMNWAASQLDSSDESIYGIALASGYQSDSAFCRVFRQHFELSPTEYRKQNNIGV